MSSAFFTPISPVQNPWTKIHPCGTVGVSKNRDTPKWMFIMVFSLLKWMIWGYSLFLETPMCICYKSRSMEGVPDLRFLQGWVSRYLLEVKNKTPKNTWEKPMKKAWGQFVSFRWCMWILCVSKMRRPEVSEILVVIRCLFLCFCWFKVERHAFGCLFSMFSDVLKEGPWQQFWPWTSASVDPWNGWFQKQWYPKSSISIGFSIISHPFWGTLIFGTSIFY